MRTESDLRDPQGRRALAPLLVRHSPFAILLLAGLLLSTLLSAAPAQETNSAAVTPETAAAPATNSDEALRTYLQLQEQIQTLQLLLERTRRESELASARSSELISDRLQAVEQSLNLQHSREWESVQSSNHTLIVLAAIFAGVGMLAMLLTALFQWRTVHALSEFSAALPPFRGLAPPPVAGPLGPSDSQLPAGSATVHSNMRLLGAIDRLEQRLEQLENSTQKPTALRAASTPLASVAAPETPASALVSPPEHSSDKATANGKSEHTEPAAPTEHDSEAPALLLAKVQTLLNMDQFQEALDTCERILALEPANTEALIRKGMASERLGRFEDAHACYDRAIAADGSLTIAYLYKGGLYNRQEKFTEALHCYEQALRINAKPANQEAA